eukprot:2514515-Heterocapsa_arctica.AAC.1
MRSARATIGRVTLLTTKLRSKASPYHVVHCRRRLPKSNVPELPGSVVVNITSAMQFTVSSSKAMTALHSAAL